MSLKISDTIIEKMIYLRTKERKSIKEIKKILGLSVGTVSKYLKNYKLIDTELEERQRKGRNNRKENNNYKKKRFYDNDISKFQNELKNIKNDRKGKISEAAILYRLLIYDFEVYTSLFDGGKIDFVVFLNNYKKLVKIQVKTIYNSNQLRIRCSNGRNKYRKYNNNEFDFIIGYDILRDNAYIFSCKSLENIKNTVIVTEESKENWNIVKEFCIN